MTHGRIEIGKHAPTSTTERLRTGRDEAAYNGGRGTGLGLVDAGHRRAVQRPRFKADDSFPDVSCTGSIVLAISTPGPQAGVHVQFVPNLPDLLAFELFTDSRTGSYWSSSRVS
jgi:hypothetical protein